MVRLFYKRFTESLIIQCFFAAQQGNELLAAFVWHDDIGRILVEHGEYLPGFVLNACHRQKSSQSLLFTIYFLFCDNKSNSVVPTLAE